MNYTKEITAMMHKALPRLKELTPGCLIRGPGEKSVQQLSEQEFHHMIGFIKSLIKDGELETLGHPITPLHLLEVLQEKSSELSAGVMAVGQIFFLRKGELMMDLWLDLKLPLDQQSEEVQKEIYLLLKSFLGTNNN